MMLQNGQTHIRNLKEFIHKDIFACLFSIHNISLSCHEQVCLSGLRFERYFSDHRCHLNDGRSISRNVAHLNILVHDMINLKHLLQDFQSVFDHFGILSIKGLRYWSLYLTRDHHKEES